MHFFRRALRHANSSRTIKCLLAAAIIAIGWATGAVAQTITEFPLPIDNAGFVLGGNANVIAAGSDGNLWFTMSGEGIDGINEALIGRITPGGAITESSPVDPNTNTILSGIAAGPDGNIWFTDAPDTIARLNPTTGVITKFPQGLIIDPFANMENTFIAAGPDG